MSSYFDDYIFNKGYCTVFMDSLQVNSIGSGHSKINFSLYQKILSRDSSIFKRWSAGEIL